MPNDPATTSQYPIQNDSEGPPVINIPASAVPPQINTAPHPYEQQVTRLVVDGEEKLVSHQDLVNMAQRGASSDSRFQDAAAKSKEADQAISFKADMDLLAETGDISAFRRAGAAMGMSGDEVEEAAALVFEADGDQLSPDETGAGVVSQYANPPNPAQGGTPMEQRIAALEAALTRTTALLEGRGRTKFGDLDETLQTVVVDVEQARVDKIIQKGLDSDDVLSYYMKAMDTNGQEAIRSMIDEKVRGRLDASDGKFGDGARILREVLPEVRSTVEALGTSNRTTPQLGLGPAPGGQGEADIYPRKRPAHVPSTEPGFEESISQELAYNMFKGSAG